MDILDTLFQWIKDIPPLESPQRFGNRAFKSFIQNLIQVRYAYFIHIHIFIPLTVKKNSERLLEDLLGNENPAIIELKVYLDTAFGNATRLDYVLSLCIYSD